MNIQNRFLSRCKSSKVYRIRKAVTPDSLSWTTLKLNHVLIILPRLPNILKISRIQLDLEL